ncbi:hypothetical protein DSM112329_02910 [Paraconexibacter sp. AEG42_29]|uniref:Uncharacterized protein n=1 Tax=Paraconexibacter sp. AEG42_29 TaxID=2997339 RepID=A0AAU7AWH1_9ACTN
MDGDTPPPREERIAPDRADPVAWCGYAEESALVLLVATTSHLDTALGCLVRENKEAIHIALFEVWPAPDPHADWIKQTRSIGADTLVRVRLGAPVAGRRVIDLTTGQQHTRIAPAGAVVEALRVADDYGCAAVLAAFSRHPPSA